MPSAHSPLPFLPAPDEAILTRLFETDAPSLPDLFKSLTQSPIDGAPKTLLDLYRWSQRDDIATWLDFHALQQAAAIRRRRILKLEQIADTSKDLVEQRRACTTVLRALDYSRKVSRPSGPPSLTTRAGASPPPRPFAPPSEPRPSGSGPRQPPTAPTPAESAHQAAPSPLHPLTCSPLHPLTCSPVHPSHSEPAHEPAPSPIHPSTHSPLHSSPPSPDSLLELAVAHTLTPRDPASIAALAGALAPNATVNGAPIDPRGVQHNIAALPDPSCTLAAIDPPAVEITDSTLTWSSTFTFENSHRFHFHLVLTRIDDQWLISAIDHHPINSS